MSQENRIHQLFQDFKAGKKPDDFSSTEKNAIEEVLEKLDQGQIRVCEKINDSWVTHTWIKEAVLLYFTIKKMNPIHAGDLQFFDKVPLKKWTEAQKVRVVPHALARYGSFIEAGAILMPSYVNIGARVGAGTMVDTWATVGSCAQIGKNVHLSGGVGIGGVLEPVQASPVIIEDNCFIGSRCIVVEGAHIEEGAVLGAGVTITASTKIIDVTDDEPQYYHGKVPKNCVVIPGSIPKIFPAGEYNIPCALIIGQRKPSTDLKTSLTEALRDFSVQA
jgi:2,3,4,5-tetrahydropyridine-2-carboxylate N-succinyltransferase